VEPADLLRAAAEVVWFDNCGHRRATSSWNAGA
jgi:hypothetical protein